MSPDICGAKTKNIFLVALSRLDSQKSELRVLYWICETKKVFSSQKVFQYYSTETFLSVQVLSMFLQFLLGADRSRCKPRTDLSSAHVDVLMLSKTTALPSTDSALHHRGDK